MKTIKEQVGGRPLSAVTPEKKLMDPSSRPVVDGKAQQLWVASVSPEATMSCIVEVGRASSLMRMATTQLDAVVARASPHTKKHDFSSSLQSDRATQDLQAPAASKRQETSRKAQRSEAPP